MVQLLSIDKLSCKNFRSYENIDLNFASFKCTLICELEAFKGTVIAAINFLIDPNFEVKLNAQNSLESSCPENISVTINFTYLNSNDKTAQATVTRTYSAIGFVSIETIDGVETKTIEDFQKEYKTYKNFYFPFDNFPIGKSWGHENCLNFFKSSYRKTNNIKAKIEEGIAFIQAKVGHEIEDFDTGDMTLAMSTLYRLSCFEPLHFHKAYFSLMDWTNLVFKNISNDEYALRFLIQTDRGVKLLTKESIESSSFDNSITFIRTGIGNEDIVWTNANRVLKTVLRIAIQIAIAHLYRFPIIFVNLNEHGLNESSQHTMDSLVENGSERAMLQLDIKYLQNIIKLCEELEFQLFIESDFCIDRGNSNIVLCNEREYWTMQNMSVSDTGEGEIASFNSKLNDFTPAMKSTPL